MKKPLLLITILSVLLNLGLIYFFIFKGATTASEDNRTAIAMSQEHANFVMAEMRGFLESVQIINEGILEKDATNIIQVKEKSGGSVVAHSPKGLMRTLPMGFKQMGFATHDIFDEISETAKTNFDPHQTQIQLDRLLNTCTACHKAFKVKVNVGDN